MILLVVILFCIPALSETIEIGSGSSVIGLDEYTTIENTIDIQPHAALVLDKLGEYGEASGDKNKYIVIYLDICNISYDDIVLDDIVSAELTYADRYTFTPYKKDIANSFVEALLGKWKGHWGIDGDNQYEVELEFTSGDNGKVNASFYYEDSSRHGKYEIEVALNESKRTLTWSGYKWIEEDGNWTFDSSELFVLDESWMAGTINSTDPVYYQRQINTEANEVTLSMLEEVSYPLVFLVPNRVVDDLDNTRVELVVNGNHYQIALK